MKWDDVWQKKASLNDKEQREINGWEQTSCKSEEVFKRIKKELDIRSGSSILEIGCGSGYLSDEFIKRDYKFYGIDKSENMIKAAQKIYSNKIFCVSEANYLKFEEKSFDYVILYSVAQYFADYEYFFKTLNEMKRTAKKGLYVGDLIINSSRKEHLKFKKEDFTSPWIISDGVYSDNRFNVYQII